MQWLMFSSLVCLPFQASRLWEFLVEEPTVICLWRFVVFLLDGSSVQASR